MTRLQQDIALLERAAAIAGKAIWPDEAAVTVPPATLEALADELAQARLRPVEYRLIGDEACWLIQAARNLVIHGADQNGVMVERWRRIAELLRAGVALDLENARKSLGGLA